MREALLFLFVFWGLCGALLGWSRLGNAEQRSIWGLIALTPLAVPSAALYPSWAMLICGVVFGLSYSAIMFVGLRLPVSISLVLTSSQTLVWALFALGAGRLWRLPSPFDIVCLASWGTFLFWVEWTLLPLWGTAQNFACSSPLNFLFIGAFGAAGGTWSVIFFWACMNLLHKQDGTARPMIVFTMSWFCILVLAWFNTRLRRKSLTTLRVATFGWADDAPDTSEPLPASYQDAAKQANEQGARLLVTPEAAMRVSDRTNFRVALCSLAQRYDLALAVGYFDQENNQNCIDFVSSQGEVVGRYVKTHLVPVLERYNRGRGEVVLMDVDGVKVGGLICQDDNFPDIARRYGRAGAQLLAVPTNDWKRVKDVHFQNHRWRALENRFALARAAMNGVSALTSCDGKVAIGRDHFAEGTRLLVADVRVGTGRPTFYARTGDWFPVVCGVVALAGLWWAH